MSGPKSPAIAKLAGDARCECCIANNLDVVTHSSLSIQGSPYATALHLTLKPPHSLATVRVKPSTCTQASHVAMTSVTELYRHSLKVQRAGHC